MLRLVVPLFALLTCGLAATVDECVWGESYWCASLENAKTCGAFEHCKSTVWTNQILKTGDSEVCDFCKSIVKDVANFFKDNRTEQDILRYVKTACSMIPEKSLADECNKIADNFVVELIHLVASDVDPKTICGLMRLCAGFEDTVLHSKLPAKPDSLPLAKLSPLPVEVQGEPICTDCKKFFTDIKNLISSNATEEEIEQLIDQEICARLGSYESMCKELVKAYLPEIMTLLTTSFDPAMLCQTLGFCSGTSKEAKNLFLKFQENSHFSTLTKHLKSTENCDLCKTIMKDLQDLDRDQNMQESVKKFLKTEVCDRLPLEGRIACEGFVDLYARQMFELIANELDPESRCRSWGFCPAEITARDVVRESTPVKAPESGRPVKASPLCVLCEFIMSEIKDMIGKNSTKEEIIAALDKVCNILPSTIKTSCIDFVKQYGEVIIDLLIQELDPQLVCTTLGLCNEKERVIPTAVGSTETCVVCESVVQYLEALLEQNETVTEIEALLKKICNFLPSTYRSTCDYVVDKYGPYIIQYITTALTPKAVCELAGACPTLMITEPKVVKVVQKPLGKNECTWGPKYWCASRENAKACQATDFCEQTGWNV